MTKKFWQAFDGAEPPVVPVLRARRSDHLATVATTLASCGVRSLEITHLLDKFEVLVCAGEYERGKPAPDVYLEAARRLGIAPDRLLVVEDSRNGILAAKAAGMTALLVPNATIPPAPGTSEAADITLGSIAELDPAELGLRARRPRPRRRRVPSEHAT